VSEITWKKLWLFFLKVFGAIFILTFLSGLLVVSIKFSVSDNLKQIDLALPLFIAGKNAGERNFSEGLDQIWQQGGVQKRSVLVDFGEDTATIDLSFVMKESDETAGFVLFGGMKQYPRLVAEKIFGKLQIDGIEPADEDYQPSIKIDPKLGIVEAHFLTTFAIENDALIQIFPEPNQSDPKTISDEVIVHYKGRKLTSVYPPPSDASEDSIKITQSDSTSLSGLMVSTQLKPTILSSFLSRQSLLQNLGNAFKNIPFIGGLLNSILDVLPLLMLLAILWAKKDVLSNSLLFLREIFLALLAFHFALSMIGMAAGLESFIIYITLSGQSWITNWLGQSPLLDKIASENGFGVINVYMIVLGVILPVLLLRRSHDWDAQGYEGAELSDPLRPHDRTVTSRFKFSFLGLFTSIIIILFMALPIYYLNTPAPEAAEWIGWALAACLAAGFLGSLLIWTARYLYITLDGRPVPASISSIVFWTAVIGSLLIGLIFDSQMSETSDWVLLTNWLWLVFNTCLGAGLIYAMMRIMYSLIKQVGIATALSRRRHMILIFAAILLAIPLNALNSSSPHPLFMDFYSIVDLAVQFDNLIKFAFLAGLTWVFFEQGKQSAALNDLTLAVGILGMATVLYPFNARWLFIPITFLFGYRLLSRFVRSSDHWKELEPLQARVFDERISFLEQIVHLNTGERSYRGLYKALSEKLAKADITYTEFINQMNERRKELDESNEAAKVGGKLIKDVALTFGPRLTAWENGVHGAFWAFLFSLPWMLIWLYGFMTEKASTSAYPLWVFFNEMLSLLISWVGIGFLFGYFYPFLRGKNGLQKGLWLWLVIILPALPLALITNDTVTSWQGFLFWILQIFIHCMLLGLIAFDYMTLRQGYRDWQMLFELHGIPSVGVSLSTMLVAIGTAVTALFQAQTQQIISAALTFIIPHVDKVIPNLPK